MVAKAKKIKEEAPTIGQLTCFRCGTRWFPKRPGALPGTCPHCKNPRWNTPRPGVETEGPSANEQRYLDMMLSLMRKGDPGEVKLLRQWVELRYSAVEQQANAKEG